MWLFVKKDKDIIKPGSYTEMHFSIIEEEFNKLFNSYDINDVDQPFFDFGFKYKFLSNLRKEMWLAEQQFDPKKTSEISKQLVLFLKDKGYKPYELVKIMSSFEDTLHYVRVTEQQMSETTQKVLNNVATMEGINESSKNEVIRVLESKLSQYGKNEQKETDLLKYATPWYVELYKAYKEKGMAKELEAMQDIQFVKNEQGMIDCHFKSLGIYISQKLRTQSTRPESKDKMSSFEWLYSYPSTSDLDKLLAVCPWDTVNVNAAILNRILNVRRLYIKESFDHPPTIYGVNWTIGDNVCVWKTHMNQNYRADTFWVRYDDKKSPSNSSADKRGFI